MYTILTYLLTSLALSTLSIAGTSEQNFYTPVDLTFAGSYQTIEKLKKYTGQNVENLDFDWSTLKASPRDINKWLDLIRQNNLPSSLADFMKIEEVSLNQYNYKDSQKVIYPDIHAYKETVITQAITTYTKLLDMEQTASYPGKGKPLKPILAHSIQAVIAVKNLATAYHTYKGTTLKSSSQNEEKLKLAGLYKK